MEAGAFVAAGIAALFAYQQLAVMRETLQASERAWLLPESDTARFQLGGSGNLPGAFAQLQHTFKNYGQGPAFDATASFFFSFGRPDASKINNAKWQRPNERTTIVPPGERHIASTDILAVVFPKSPNQIPKGMSLLSVARRLGRRALKDAFRRKQGNGVFVGIRLSYRDQFGEERHTQTFYRVFRSPGGKFNVAAEAQFTTAD